LVFCAFLQTHRTCEAGSLEVWAILSMIVINRSEPDWTPGPRGTIAKDFIFLGAALGVTGVIGYTHRFFGLAPFSG